MNSPATALSAPNPNTLLAILWGALLCGVLDITAALVVYGSMGAKPLRLLQGIAAGLLGPRTYGGGIATALLGLLCHFVIPLSAAAKFPFSLKMMVIGIIIHIFCVGLPLALAARRFAAYQP